MAKIKYNDHSHTQKFRKRPNKPKIRPIKRKRSPTATQVRPLADALATTAADGLLEPKLEPVEYITLD